jgi:hypothetical protein
MGKWDNDYCQYEMTLQNIPFGTLVYGNTELKRNNTALLMEPKNGTPKYNAFNLKYKPIRTSTWSPTLTKKSIKIY